MGTGDTRRGVRRERTYTGSCTPHQAHRPGQVRLGSLSRVGASPTAVVASNFSDTLTVTWGLGRPKSPRVPVFSPTLRVVSVGGRGVRVRDLNVLDG